MCLGCVCTRSFSNPYGHVMHADLYQTAELRFCLDSCILEGILVLFFWFVFLGRNLEKWRNLIINNIITMNIIYFDVGCQEILAPGTKHKWDRVKKYVYFLQFWTLPRSSAFHGSIGAWKQKLFGKNVCFYGIWNRLTPVLTVSCSWRL